MDEQEILNNIYERALSLYQRDELTHVTPATYHNQIQVIIDHQEQNKAVLAVLITLLVKKIHTPDQDIRQHQAQMEGGFSGRGLDTRIITPFLREQQFPYMMSGSG